MKLYFPASIWRTFVLIHVVSFCLQSSSLWAAEPSGELARRLAEVKFDHYAQAPGYSEGPTWRQGVVYFCSGGLLRVAPDKSVSPYLDLGPAGTALRQDGHLLICDNKYKALLDLSPEGTVRVIVDQFENRPLRSLNDLTIDARGNVYWTDPEGSSLQTPIGSVFRVRPDGRVDRVATGLAFPNGLEVDPQNQFLYVIESQSKKILRYAVPADHEPLGKPVVFYDLAGSGGDGCAFDAAGNLWVADFHRPESGHGRITVLSPDAEVLAYLNVPAKVISNIAFGGAEHDEIYCTAGEPPGVFHAKVGIKGFAGHPGKPIPAVRTLNLVVRHPHPDSALLQKIAKAAGDAKVTEGKWDDAPRAEIRSQMDSLTDSRVRQQSLALLPTLEKAAIRATANQALLSEVKRLNGKATIEVDAPDWLRSIAGDDALGVFGQIVELNLNERTDGHKEPEARPLSQRVHDETLKLLAGQNALRRLELSGTAVTSAGLVFLKDLTNLQYLNLCLTAVSDEGFEHLAHLTRMRRMTVCSSRISGSGFCHLTEMKQLESINLHSSPASDQGLEAIGKLTSLKRLEIVHTNVSDAGLAHIASLTNLRQLHIHGKDATESGLPFLGTLKDLYELDLYDRLASNETLALVSQLPRLRMLRLFGGTFDDAGVRGLSPVKTLEELALNSSNVTDGSVELLGTMTSLRKINVAGSRISDEGKRRLKSLLPLLEITP